MEGRRPFLIPGHGGPVIGLIDSDMAPLRGPNAPGGGAPMGEAIVERKGGPLLRRALTGAERAMVCAELFIKSWRAAGVRTVTALRPKPGMDFNDAIRGDAA